MLKKGRRMPNQINPTLSLSLQPFLLEIQVGSSHCLLQVLWQLRAKLHNLVGRGVNQLQPKSVKGLPTNVILRCAIEHVA